MPSRTAPNHRADSPRGAGAVRRGHLLRQQSQIRVEADRRQRRYSPSSRAFCSTVAPSRPLIWAQPVKPGRISFAHSNREPESGRIPPESWGAVPRRSSLLSRRKKTLKAPICWIIGLICSFLYCQWHCGQRIAPANRGNRFAHNKKRPTTIRRVGSSQKTASLP